MVYRRFTSHVFLFCLASAFIAFLFTSSFRPIRAARTAYAGTFAPYVDVTLWPPFDLAQNANTTGVKTYTLGFIVAKGHGDCRASWGTYYLMSENWFGDKVQQVRANGGDVIASFGGASNSELAEACASVNTLKTQYKAVIDHYALTQLDFDIEGAQSHK